MTRIYTQGEEISTVGQFYLDAAPFAPSSVTLVIIDPSYVTTTIVAPNASIFNDSTGRYEHDITLDQVGVWRIWWTGIGTWTDSHSRVRPYRQEIYEQLSVRIPIPA